MKRGFVLTIPVQRVPDGRKQKLYRDALKKVAPWVKEVGFLKERDQPIVRVVCEGVSVDQSKALSMIRTELQQHAVEFVYKSSDVGEYQPKSDGWCVSEEL